MTDKTQLEAIAKLLVGHCFMPPDHDIDAGDMELEIARSVAQQILDLCQPKWIYVSERLPDAEPHRNIEIACVSPYPEDEKSPYSTHVSTMIPVTAFEGAYAWREVVLPKPVQPEKLAEKS